VRRPEDGIGTVEDQPVPAVRAALQAVEQPRKARVLDDVAQVGAGIDLNSRGVVKDCLRLS
jgi:hypothetical protein